MHGSAGSHSRSAPLWGAVVRARGVKQAGHVFTAGLDEIFLESRRSQVRRPAAQAGTLLHYNAACRSEGCCRYQCRSWSHHVSVCFFQGVANTLARQILLRQQQHVQLLAARWLVPEPMAFHFQLIPFSKAFLIATECVCSGRHDCLSNTPSRIVVA